MAGVATRAPHVDCDPRRVEELFQAHQLRVWTQTDRMLGVLILAQWAFAIILAIVWSPFGWAGKQHVVHLHVHAAVFLGGLLAAFPLVMIQLRPGAFATRNVVAIAQMLWSALLIHLSGGRIETHFHIFGSLAFVAFYRDWRVLIPATVVVSADHVIRGVYWPESVYGIVNPEWWRFLEHAGWVVFEDIVLVAACLRAVDEMREMARHQALVEARYAAVGRLAASVAHELRNPLAAVKNAAAYLNRKLPPSTSAKDRSHEFLTLINSEVDECSAILSDLIEFARTKPLLVGPCSLRSLVSDAAARVRPIAGKCVKVENEVADDLAPPLVDSEQLSRAVLNLLQNAVNTYPKGRDGRVVVSATGAAESGWSIAIRDDGDGIAAADLPNVFEPLVTEKQRDTGTGLALALVAAVVERHQGQIQVDSNPQGTTFTIKLPPPHVVRAAVERSVAR